MREAKGLQMVESTKQSQRYVIGRELTGWALRFLAQVIRG